MKKYFLFLLIGFLLAIPFSANANTISVDGNFSLSEWAGNFSEDDTNDSWGLNYFLDPGYGGQLYDVEYLGLYIEGGTVYFGLQTGFDVVNGRYDNGSSLQIDSGDFALDIGGDGTYEFAIDFSIGSSGVTYSLIDMYSATWQSVYYPQHSAAGPFEALYLDSDVIDTFNVINGYGVSGVHYTLEGAFQLDSLGANLSGETIAINWTMECGNDYLNTKTTAPVPEPATMLLLGTGLIGLAGFGRKKFLK